MLYSEFVEGTGCRETDHNYKVYKDLEVLYMNSNLSKAEIYEYGKKLVDNSKTEQELALEKRIEEEIAYYKEQIVQLKKDLEAYKEAYRTETDSIWKAHWKDSVNRYQDALRKCRAQIRALKWVLA